MLFDATRHIIADACVQRSLSAQRKEVDKPRGADFGSLFQVGQQLPDSQFFGLRLNFNRQRLLAPDIGKISNVDVVMTSLPVQARPSLPADWTDET